MKAIFSFAIEHVLSILASLFRNLTGNQRSRLVQKFVEEDHIKVRLVNGILLTGKRVTDLSILQEYALVFLCLG
jgi:hypothetical protein